MLERRIIFIAFVLAAFGNTSFAAGSGVYVNGVELDDKTLNSLEQSHGVSVESIKLNPDQIEMVRELYGVEIKNGHFWYDRISGAWGYEGLPAAGSLLPGLNIGGALKEDASGGGTNIIVNGRILHPSEVRYLETRFGYVIPGSYYLLPNGSYGFVGGPIMGTIAPHRRSSMASRDKFGTVLGGDGYVGYMPPGGAGSTGVSVSCAPDGGCIYH